MCVCVVCVCVCVCVCKYTCVDTLYVHTRACVIERPCTCVLMHAYVLVCMCVRFNQEFVYMHVNDHKFVYMYVNI
jgi:hypothetical protein